LRAAKKNAEKTMTSVLGDYETTNQRQIFPQEGLALCRRWIDIALKQVRR
jgi:hypothetical protein